MRNNELKTRLEKLEDKLFGLNMIDRWTPEVARLVRETEIEIEDVKRELGQQTKFFYRVGRTYVRFGCPGDFVKKLTRLY